MTQTNYKRQDINLAIYSKLSLAEQADMFSQLLDRCCQFEQSAARAEEKIAQLEQSAQLAREYAGKTDSVFNLIRAWMQNPNMQATATAVLIGTYLAIEEARANGAPEKDGKARVWRSRAAALGGVSVNTISDYWAVFEDSGLLLREHDGKSDGGTIQKFVYLSLTPQAIINAADFKLSNEKKKGQGGKRIPRCPHCQSLDILKETKYTCQGCGVSGMTKKELNYVTEELLASEAAMDAQLQQDLAAIENPPTCEKPTRACFNCGDNAYTYDALAGKLVPNDSWTDTWVWDGKAGKWVCGECEGQVQA